MTMLAKGAEGNRPVEESVKLQPGLFPKSKQFGVAGAHAGMEGCAGWDLTMRRCRVVLLKHVCT